MCIIQEKKENQLIHLDDVITKEEYYYNDKFRLMNNEAGSGKSQQTFKSIAKLATTTEKKIVYVQMFANKNVEKQDAQELKNTVKIINELAEKKIAKYICAENFKEHKQILATAQVICITHKKYLELCKEKSKSNFITNSDVLIIDEFPSLYESFRVSELELTVLQGFSLLTLKEKEDIEEMNKFMLIKLSEIQENYKKEYRIINLQKLDVKKYIKVLETIITNAKKDNKMAHKRTIEIANRVLELFSHSSVYTEEKIGNKVYPVLYSFYKDTGYILAKENNIILDANGGFDKRYKLRKDFFKLDYQSKVFDYNDSKINLYPISTTKTSLQKYKHIITDVADYIDYKKRGFISLNTLIVTDIVRENELTELQKEYYDLFYDMALAHFGALIGKNDWKDFNNAWIIKTPFYGWIEYILQYLFYSRQDLNGNTSCSIKSKKGLYNNYPIFANKQFNELKNSIVKGEYYQALKRIARDGRQCTFNIVMSDESIYEDLREEFKNIKDEIKTDLCLKEKQKKEHSKTGKKPEKTNERIKFISDYITKAKEEGKEKILKSEITQLLEIKNTKLSPLLKQINSVKFTVGTGKEQAYIFI